MRSLLFVVAVVAVINASCGTEEKTCGGGEPYYPLEVGAWWRDQVIDSGNIADCPDKVVSIEEPGTIRLRPGYSTVVREIVAFPARSESEDSYSYRWQEVTEDGSVRRHLDVTFDNATELPTEIVHYCPYKIRVDDGAHACAGAKWTETWTELTITVGADAVGPEPCADIVVNSATCLGNDDQPVEPAAGCTVTTLQCTRDWEVVAVDEEKTVGSTTYSALHLHTLEACGETSEGKNWWWVRGLGKIAEDSGDPGEEVEELVDYCLPTPTDDCQASKPSYEELQGECEE